MGLMGLIDRTLGILGTPDGFLRKFQLILSLPSNSQLVNVLLNSTTGSEKAHC